MRIFATERDPMGRLKCECTCCICACAAFGGHGGKGIRIGALGDGGFGAVAFAVYICIEDVFLSCGWDRMKDLEPWRSVCMYESKENIVCMDGMTGKVWGKRADT